MGTGLDGEPNIYTAGEDFDYSVWTAGTQVDLVNVNWDGEYRSVVKFASKTALNNHINSLQSAGIRLTKLTYCKPGQDIFLPIPYNRVNRYNYLRASNPLMPIADDLQKDYYYFIVDCEYINPQTTRIRVQLDVWQTFVYDVSFGNCYVERGHIGIANSNQFDNYGRDYLTVPEGLDIGADYRTIVTRKDEVVGHDNLTSEIDVLIFTTTDLLQDPGTQVDPNMDTGPGSTINGMPSGATAYVFPSTLAFSSWLNSMKEYPWITQGILSVNAIPKLNRYLGPYSFDYEPDGPTRITYLWLYPKKHKFFPNWRNNSGFTVNIDPKYRHLKKFFTAPYMVIEMTTWSGTPVAIRPEAWNNPDAFVLERPSFMPPNQRVQFTPRSYNSNGQEIEGYLGLTYEDLLSIPGMTVPTANQLWAILSEAGDDYGDYLDIMTQIADFPSLPIVNNMAISYMASNAHSIAYQRKSAQWTESRAIGLAQGQYDIAQRGIDTSRAMTENAVAANRASTASTNQNLMGQAIVSGVGGVVGGAGAGAVFGPVGAAAGAVSGTAQAITGMVSAGLNQQNNDMQTAIQNNQLWSNQGEQAKLANYSSNTNQNLAEFAARGDYANAIAGVNARVQDAEMIQPSVAGQFGGDMANISHGAMEISIRWKLIDEAAVRIIGDYWLRFGYAIRAFITPPQSLMVMTKFTYWKMTEAYLTSSMVPESHKNSLRGILEKGVTVYGDPDDIGMVDFADNDPLSGVSY